MLITFSGLDGAGKTTLIATLQRQLALERPVIVLTMYDHLTVFSLLRRLRDAILGRRHVARVDLDDRGNVVQASTKTSAAVYRLTRHVWLRQVAHLFDLPIASAILMYQQRVRGRVVLLDRYFYDSMVDIAAARPGKWFYSSADAADLSPGRWRYINLILSLARKPDASILVDVAPEVAYARKPEYPLAYLQARRVVYLKLFRDVIPGATIIENADMAVSEQRLSDLARDVA